MGVILTWTQFYLGRVAHVTSTDVGSKVLYGPFGVIDLLVKLFWSLYPHTWMYFHGN